MENLFITLMLSSIVLVAMPGVHAHLKIEDRELLKKWYRNFPQMKQKVTELHFYLHDVVSGPYPTNVPIIVSNFTQHSHTYFGMVAAMDDLVTIGSSPNSEVMGRAQGLFVSGSLATTNYQMTFNFVFTHGKYNGSTLSIAGANPFLNEHRKLPVVGGTGIFRLASGSALLETLNYNATSGDSIVEYDVMVLHY